MVPQIKQSLQVFILIMKDIRHDERQERDELMEIILELTGELIPSTD